MIGVVVWPAPAKARTFASETVLAREVIARICGPYGGFAVKIHGGLHNRGEPDIDGCVAGRMVKVELKMPGEVPSVLQLAALRRWERAGALAGWCTSLVGLDELLERLPEVGWANPQLLRRAD